MNSHLLKSKSVFLMSLLFAIFLNIKCLNAIIISFNNVLVGSIMSYLYIVVFGALTLTAIIYKKRLLSGISFKSFVVLSYILCLWLISLFLDGKPHVSVLFFLVFTIAAFLIPHIITVDVRILLKATMLIPCLAVFNIDKIFVFAYDYMDAVSIGLSYSFLVPISATIIYIFQYFKYENKCQKVLTIFAFFSNGIFLLQLLMFGSRGPLLGIICMMLFLFITKAPNTDSIGIRFNKKRFISTVIFMIMLCVSMFSLLDYMQSYLIEHNISFNFVDKMLALEDNGDVTNGRATLSGIAWQGFLDSPLLGNGFDRFEANTREVYPHNFILQILYDGGFLFFFILIVPLIRTFIKRFNNCSFHEYVFLTLLLFISVPGALLTADLWEQSMLWTFFGYVLSNNKIAVL